MPETEIGPIPPVLLRLAPAVKLSDKQLFRICGLNDGLRIEQTAEGDLVIMTPEGSESGNTNFNLAARFSPWVLADGTGVGFGSSAGFRLPNGAMRNPDLAWIRRERWEALPRAQRRRFAPVCPDFVGELRAPSDPLRHLQDKMQEYIDNGAQLGWLIDPDEKTVYVYRPGEPVQRLDNPSSVSADPVLPGFVLELQTFWPA